MPNLLLVEMAPDILFRLYVTSRLDNLKYLDDRRIDEDERSQSHAMYPK